MRHHSPALPAIFLKDCCCFFHGLFTHAALQICYFSNTSASQANFIGDLTVLCTCFPFERTPNGGVSGVTEYCENWRVWMRVKSYAQVISHGLVILRYDIKDIRVDMFISSHEIAFMKLKKYIITWNFVPSLPSCQTVHALWQINNQNRTEIQNKRPHNSRHRKQFDKA